jgi:hypothetical protein
MAKAKTMLVPSKVIPRQAAGLLALSRTITTFVGPSPPKIVMGSG